MNLQLSERAETILFWVLTMIVFCLPVLTWRLRLKRDDMKRATGAKKVLRFFLSCAPGFSVALTNLRFLQFRDIVGVHIPQGRIVLGWVGLGYIILLGLCLCAAGLVFLISMVRGKEDI